MNILKQKVRISLLLSLVLVWAISLPVLASADDNSLSALNVQNGTVSPEFVYSTWEYNVTVEPGTEELYLEPALSNSNATITSITGTVLQDGQATVRINTLSESGMAMTYTLYVTEAETGGDEAEEVVEEPATEAVTEAPTEAATEAATTAETTTATEVQNEGVATNALQDQVAKMKSDSDLMIKIVYGLIILSVLLLFFVINLILRNRDLKDDLKDAEDQLAYQTNEFARKEKFMVTDNYYAPTQQGEAPKPSGKAEPAKPEAQSNQPQAGTQPEAETPEVQTQPEAEPQPEKKDEVMEAEDKKDVNVTMVDL